jgi:hypothetical protein
LYERTFGARPYKQHGRAADPPGEHADRNPCDVAVRLRFFGPWQQYRRTIARGDLTAAHPALSRVRVVMGVILGLGLLASVVSAVGRYL